jgi:hypothetical protein
MSTKTKASQTTGGCCTRKGVLTVDAFNQQVYGLFDLYLGDPFGPIDPPGLGGQLGSKTINIEIDASNDCKQRIKKEIEQFMRNAIAVGFGKWLQSGSQQINLISGISPAYNLIRFLGIFTPWEFEVLCCDNAQSAGILTDMSTFPHFYAHKLIRDQDPDVLLTPTIICGPTF